MLPYQKTFLLAAYRAAKTATHIFPQMAACEAGLESGYGRSLLAQDNNLFGMKLHSHPDHPEWKEVALPTKEVENSQWVSCNSKWLWYPDWASCFSDRMATLERLAPFYPHYKNALMAGSPVTYIMEVSRTWSTDPERANKVLALYDACGGDWTDPQTISL